MIKTLLVTSTGGTVGRLIIEMIREALPQTSRIVAADTAVDVSYLGDFVTPARLPHATDPAYGAALRQLIAQEEIDAVLPLSEDECLIVSKLAQTNRLGDARYIGMGRETLDVITNKPHCIQVLSQAGLDVPTCIRIKDLKTLGAGLSQLGYPDVPVVLKPVRARGSRGFRIVYAETNRVTEMERKGGQIFIDADQARGIFRGQQEALQGYFLMEFLPGGSLSIDISAWKGNILGAFPHRRLGYEWGFVDYAEICHDPDAEAYARAVTEILCMHGMCNIELGYRADGRLSLIEVNGRTSATAAQNRLVGANLFDMFLRAEEGDLQAFAFATQVKYRVLSEYRAL